MRPQEHGAPLDAWASPAPARLVNPFGAIAGFISNVIVIAELEARKLRHDPTELLLRGAQPLIWLLVFGQVFTQLRAIPTGDVRYIDFMAPGILAQSVLFISIFHGIAIIWERDLGILHKFLVSPAPRAALVLGKALSSVVRASVQAVIIYTVALLLGVQINLNPLAILGVIITVMLGATFFSTFSLIVACLVKSRERFMGIGQVMTMPLFFASNAIYPIEIMPAWLQVIARVNPLSYEVDALRSLMLTNGTSMFGLATDFAFLIVVGTLAVWIGARLYPKVVI